MRSDLADLAGRRFDVVVIGAGTNGASAAQHLAAAGYEVLVVDKGDFGSGATARSSRLLHCGLRYLAPGRSLLDFARHPDRLATALRMARQAMQARAEIVRTTPERAIAMRFCFPVYRDGPYRSWQLDLAFAILGTLGAGGGVPLDYERLAPAAAGQRPLLRGLRDPDRLVGVACFREYQLDWPERICVDAVLDAERHGARARNHTHARLVQHQPGEGGGWTVALHDTLDPATSPVEVQAARVLNLAGLWIDGVTRAVAPLARRRVVGTKGAHILVRLPGDCAGVGIAALNRRGEPFYCVPWRGLHYFGPTETLFEGDPDAVAVTPDEAAFLLAEANHLLPGYPLTSEAIVASWAGVRPLTYDETLPLGRRSREIHDLAADGLPGVFALTGGPVMTHRSAGRQLATTAAAGLSPRRKARPLTHRPPAWAPALPDAELLRATRAGEPAVTLADLRLAARVEHAATLEDALFRRLGVGWGEPLTPTEIERAATAMGQALGWTDPQRDGAARAYAGLVERLYAPRPPAAVSDRAPARRGAASPLNTPVPASHGDLQ